MTFKRGLIFFFSWLLCFGSLAPLWGQATYQISSLKIETDIYGKTYKNAVYANRPARITTSILNDGSTYASRGDSIVFLASINKKRPKCIIKDTLDANIRWLTISRSQYGLVPAPSAYSDFFSNQNYVFEASNFAATGGGGGGGGLMYDITIWPTLPTGTNSRGISITTSDTFHTRILYVTGSAMSMLPGWVNGLPSTVEFNANYNVSLSAHNVGLATTARSVMFYLQLDDGTPIRIAKSYGPVAVHSSATVSIPAFNLYHYFPSALSTPGFTSRSHSITIYARELGKENDITQAHFDVDASKPFDVELAHFDGYAQEDKIYLKWGTSEERDNSHFVVEKRGSDGVYSAVGQAPGAGTSQVFHAYQLVDPNPVAGINTYRLIQIDLDGAQRLVGQTLNVFYHMDGQSEVLMAYPSSFESSFNLRVKSAHEKKGYLDVFDQRGSLVRRMSFSFEAGVKDVYVDMSKQTPGVYIYRLRLDGRILSGKVIKTQ